jgi:hypothetical protein
MKRFLDVAPAEHETAASIAPPAFLTKTPSPDPYKNREAGLPQKGRRPRASPHPATCRRGTGWPCFWFTPG